MSGHKFMPDITTAKQFVNRIFENILKIRPLKQWSKRTDFSDGKLLLRTASMIFPGRLSWDGIFKITIYL